MNNLLTLQRLVQFNNKLFSIHMVDKRKRFCVFSISIQNNCDPPNLRLYQGSQWYTIFIYSVFYSSTFIDYLKIPPEKPPKPPLKPPPLAKPKVRRWFRRLWGSASGLGAAAGNDARTRNTTMIAAIFLNRSMMLIGLYYVEQRFQGKF